MRKPDGGRPASLRATWDRLRMSFRLDGRPSLRAHSQGFTQRLSALQNMNFAAGQTFPHVRHVPWEHTASWV
eukprot:5376055-Amphidinium_carterae.1